MTTAVALIIASAAAFLGLALLVAVRGGRRALTAPLVLMCLAMSTYNAFDALGEVTGSAIWTWHAYAAAALLTIPTWVLTARFVGMGSQLRAVTRGFGAYFVLVAVATLALPFTRGDMADFPGGPTWSLAMLLGLGPLATGAAYLLVRHARRSHGAERARVRLLAGALLLGVGGSILDMVLIIGGSSLRVSWLALLTSALLTAGLVMKTKILEGVTTLTLINVAVLACIALIGHVLVYTLSGAHLTVTVFGSTVVVLGLLAAVRPLLATIAEQRSRARHLATLGRFSEQMANDLRNPLAAIRGAAQFLQEEAAQGRSLDAHLDIFELIVDGSSRLERVIAEYQRVGSVIPVRAAMSINQLLQAVVAAETASRVGEVEVEQRLDPELPDLRADRALFAHALENLVRNALEAMPRGGKLTATTTRQCSPGGEEVRVRLVDTGCGMDARALEQAVEEFYSTKSHGAGLGLSYVARVVEAHGGRLHLASEEQVGTTVELVLPLAS